MEKKVYDSLPYQCGMTPKNAGVSYGNLAAVSQRVGAAAQVLSLRSGPADLLPGRTGSFPRAGVETVLDVFQKRSRNSPLWTLQAKHLVMGEMLLQ